MWEVLHRQKDVQYSSRVASHIARQRQVHRLRHVISRLVKHLPVEERNSPEVRELASYGCVTQMHVVRLLAPRLENEDHTKDIDFSASGIRMRWEAGYADMRETLQDPRWKERKPASHAIRVFDLTRDKEIAGELSLSVFTVRSYVKNIYEKMHVRSRTEAVVKFLEGGGDVKAREGGSQ